MTVSRDFETLGIRHIDIMSLETLVLTRTHINMVIDASLFVLPGIILMGIGFGLLLVHDWQKELLDDKWGRWSVICFLFGIIACMSYVYLIRWLVSD